MTRSDGLHRFILRDYKRKFSLCGDRTHRALRRQIMTNSPPPTQTPEPLWALPALYALSLGLFVPGILMASRPARLPTPAEPFNERTGQ